MGLIGLIRLIGLSDIGSLRSVIRRWFQTLILQLSLAEGEIG